MTLKPNEWIKSSYSASNSNDCIEVAWTKSSYSSNEGPQCVEVAPTPSTIHIRDSKNPNGPHLTVTPTAWTAFLTYASNN
ncbi:MULTISPECIES: DUF397 domain-containing protein [Streptomyces]|uniref:DUF397 domain-containing protein n=1 Tax=Streptomyces TaxID=1883 RepID=UPI0015FBBBF3|nr:DUF397 domain-containing protein [Streptomyces sp. GMR22]MBA6440009.1 DUF397 domain-containing protein [Streptomyces sp. GMR22]